MPSNVRYAEIKRLLESKGWYLDRTSGTHHIFIKPGKRQINIPVHDKQVKFVYVKKANKIIEEEGG